MGEMRWKVTYVHKQVMAELLYTMRHKKIIPWTDNLPEDVQIVDISYDFHSGRFMFVLWSEEWDEIEDRQKIPEIKIWYRWVKVVPEEKANGGNGNGNT